MQHLLHFKLQIQSVWIHFAPTRYSNHYVSFTPHLFIQKALILLGIAGCLLISTCLQQSYGQSTGLPAGFTDQLVNGGWDGAVGFTFSSDGNRMYVWEKGGKVWIVENGVKLSTPLIDIGHEVGNWRDHGMLGFALDPDFTTNGYFYLMYVVDRHHLKNYGTANYDPNVNDYNRATIGRITRYKANSATGFKTTDMNSRKVLMGQTAANGLPILQVSHGVGSLVFGTDYTLLASLGDGASPSSAPDAGSAGETYYIEALADGIITQQENVGAFRSQMLQSLNGKIIRIDPETGNGIPSNPFYDPANPGSAKSRVWAMGLRNPYRMSLKPGTGSHNPADGNPGVLYVGDVGLDTWEEVDVITGRGKNFGWPVYEGLTPSVYATKATENKYAPNPLYGVNGCTQRYFAFRDLIKQPTADGQVSFPNPCNTGQQIPSTVPHFVHTRPVLDWGHGTGPSRTGNFTGNEATTVNVGTAGSVPGPQFGGSSSTGGVWYTGTKFPPQYQNTYFHGDFGAQWMRNLSFDASHKLTKVANFVSGGAVVVFIGAHPTDGNLYYINYAAQIRRISYVSSQNQPPMAVATSDKFYGSAPLTVQFTGSNSKDPENSALTYEWNFGDNTPVSTAANPSHGFNAPSGVPTKYTVTLKVKDAQGLINQTTLFVSVNNTPPVVTITSPVNNSKYSLTQETTYNLTANVTDAQHSGSGLTYQWQTIMHHNSHTHPDPYDYKPVTTTSTEPLGCDGNIYYYRIVLTVTDAAGLSTTAEVRLDPDCSSLPVDATNLAATAGNATATIRWTNPTNRADELMLVAKEATSITGTPSGNGSSYVANLSYTGGGSVFDGGKVVYKGKTSPQTVTGLKNNVKYYFKLFTRNGSIWSNGVEVNAIPTSAPNQLPVVSLTAPLTDVYVTEGGEVDIFATASDKDGTIKRVEFYNGSTKLGEDLTAPYSFIWNKTTPGVHTITAKAIDNLDASTTSGGSGKIYVNSVSNTSFVRAINFNGDPLVIDNRQWEGKASTNYSYVSGATVGSKPTGYYQPITDANRSAMIRTYVTGSPLGINLNTASSGEYDLYLYIWEDNAAITVDISVEGQFALAYNTGGNGLWQKIGPIRARTTDNIINISFQSGGYALVSGVELWKVNATTNPAPAVSLSSPANGASFTAPATVNLTATATDADGIAKVEFYNGASKLGEDLTSPYSYSWTNVAAGSYRLTAKAIDTKGGTGTSAAVTVNVSGGTTACAGTGSITREYWANVTGTTVSAIPVTTTPTSTSQISSFETTSNAAENYGQRIRGYVCAPVTGSYTFYIASDDNSELWLSTDANPATKRRIANLNSGWAGPRDWLKYPSQKSVAISLVAGTKYYIEALHKEGTVGDNLAVGWTPPNITGIVVIPGSQLSPYTITPTNPAPAVSLSSPANGASFTAPATVNLTATATDADGIAKVEFYNGASKLGEDLTSPYSYSWTNVAAGSYRLTAKAIDTKGGTGTSAAVTVNVSGGTTACAGTGSITREYWANVTGNTLSAIPLTTAPTSTTQITSFETGTNIGSSYGQRFRGYLCVPTTGSYTFYIASDDESSLLLSTDANPATKRRIAYIGGAGWSGPREWTKYATQKSGAITLTAGTKYYIEAQHKEGSSGDNFAVGWSLPGSTAINVIAGNYLSPYTSATAREGIADEQAIEANLTAYPVPATDKVTVEFSLPAQEEVNVTLYDAKGGTIALLYRGKVEARDVHTIDVNTKHLQSGMYMIRLSGKSSVKLQKIVISR